MCSQGAFTLKCHNVQLVQALQLNNKGMPYELCCLNRNQTRLAHTDSNEATFHLGSKSQSPWCLFFSVLKILITSITNKTPKVWVCCVTFQNSYHPLSFAGKLISADTCNKSHKAQTFRSYHTISKSKKTYDSFWHWFTSAMNTVQRQHF